MLRNKIEKIMKNNKKIGNFIWFVAILLVTQFSLAQNIEAEVDKLLSENYSGNNPGVTALIYKKDKVVYRKAFGIANMELQVKMIPENVIEIGSITKQFTAVAILMLAEQGKLSVDDEITKFIPDYPANGKTITIHQLLNHTSGIKSYTGMAGFINFVRQDHSPDDIINFFKNESMDFDPGEKYLYNNSGYVLLGYIIEKISGQSYEDFLIEHIFTPLKMKNTFYGSKTNLIPNRAEGYTPNAKGWQKAIPSGMSWAYAAGAIMSNVDDMLLWHKSVHNNTLISAESKAKAFTNTTLNNGDPTNYGYGWAMGKINGSPSIEHGGGIFGYTTAGIYIPDENIYVIVLTNRDGSHPNDMTVKIAAHTLGKPYKVVNNSVLLSDELLKKWIGNYEFDEDVLRSISFEEGKLFSQREGSDKLPIFPISENEFIFEDGLTRLEFGIEDGKKIANFSDRMSKVKGFETDRKPATEKEEIEIDTKVLPDYVGAYELVPNFIITVSTKDDRLFAQATGQPQFEVYPEAADTFFLKVVAAKLVFGRDDSGKVIHVTLHQGGQEMKGMKK